MRILAVETSTHVGSVAVTDGPSVLAEMAVPARARHGELLLPNIERTLEAAGVAIGDLELLAVGIGPGSFTGLRIGLATVKGLALARSLPLVGVSSLGVLAAGLGPAGPPVAVFADAHKGEVFVGLFSRGSAEAPVAPICPAFHAPPAEAAARVRTVAGEGELIAVGDGFRRHEAVLRSALGARLRVAATLWDLPRAAVVAVLAEHTYAQDGPSDLDTLEPQYLRGSDAVLPSSPSRPAPE